MRRRQESCMPRSWAPQTASLQCCPVGDGLEGSLCVVAHGATQHCSRPVTLGLHVGACGVADGVASGVRAVACVCLYLRGPRPPGV